MLRNHHKWQSFYLPIIVATGLLVGLVWEAFEFPIGMIGGVEDTLVDLLMDALGAFCAGVLLKWLGVGSDHSCGASVNER